LGLYFNGESSTDVFFSFPLTYVSNLSETPIFQLINSPSFVSLNGNIVTVNFGDTGTNVSFNVNYKVTVGLNFSQGRMEFTVSSSDGAETINAALVADYNADAASQNAILLNSRLTFNETLNEAQFLCLSSSLCSLKNEIHSIKKMLKKSLEQSKDSQNKTKCKE
jgi:hypothetical protein